MVAIKKKKKNPERDCWIVCLPILVCAVIDFPKKDAASCRTNMNLSSLDVAHGEHLLYLLFLPTVDLLCLGYYIQIAQRKCLFWSAKDCTCCTQSTFSECRYFSLHSSWKLNFKGLMDPPPLQTRPTVLSATVTSGHLSLHHDNDSSLTKWKMIICRKSVTSGGSMNAVLTDMYRSATPPLKESSGLQSTDVQLNVAHARWRHVLLLRFPVLTCWWFHFRAPCSVSLCLQSVNTLKKNESHITSGWLST